MDGGAILPRVDSRAPSRATVGELASRLAYRSKAAFAMAFKRVMCVPPGAGVTASG